MPPLFLDILAFASFSRGKPLDMTVNTGSINYGSVTMKYRIFSEAALPRARPGDPRAPSGGNVIRFHNSIRAKNPSCLNDTDGHARAPTAS